MDTAINLITFSVFPLDPAAVVGTSYIIFLKLKNVTKERTLARAIILFSNNIYQVGRLHVPCSMYTHCVWVYRRAQLLRRRTK